MQSEEQLKRELLDSWWPLLKSNFLSSCASNIGVTHGTAGFNVKPLDHPRATYGSIAVPFFEVVKNFRDDIRLGKQLRGRKEVLGG